MTAEAEHSQWNEICKAEFEKLHAAVGRVDVAIRGNGKPGLVLRIDRLEAAAKTRSRILWMAVGAAVSLAIGSIPALWVYLCH